MKKYLNRTTLTSALEAVGGILVVIGIGTFSIPVSLIVFGVLLILAGGLLA